MRKVIFVLVVLCVFIVAACDPNAYVGNTSANAGTGTGTGSGTGTDPEKSADFCEKNPTAIACLQKGNPGTLNPETLQNKSVSLGITPKSGITKTATCPAPKRINLSGKDFDVSFQPFCDFATMINPLVIAFAWISAIGTFFGFARSS